MKLKVNHYASKEVNQKATFGFEAIFMDFFLAFIAGVFAYIGYEGKIALLLFSCILVSIVCFMAGLYSAFEQFRSYKEMKATQTEGTNGKT